MYDLLVFHIFFCAIFTHLKWNSDKYIFISVYLDGKGKRGQHKDYCIRYKYQRKGVLNKIYVAFVSVFNHLWDTVLSSV